MQKLTEMISSPMNIPIGMFNAFDFLAIYSLVRSWVELFEIESG